MARARSGVPAQRGGEGGNYTYFGDGQSHSIKRGDAHHVFQSALVFAAMEVGSTAVEIAQIPAVALEVKQVENVMKRIRKNGYFLPGRHGKHDNQATKINDWHVLWLRLRWLRQGHRYTSKRMADELYRYFGLRITPDGLRKALDRYGITHKRLTFLCKYAFTPENVELTRRVSPLFVLFVPTVPSKLFLSSF
jgi:transposase